MSSTIASGSPRLEGVERGVGDHRRIGLLRLQAGRQVGVDVADVHADDVRALGPQLHPGRVGVAPGRGLRRRIGREDRAGHPRADRQHVDERATAVGLQDRRERLRGAHDAQHVDLELPTRALQVGLKRRSGLGDPGVVEHQLHVPRQRRGREHVGVVGDVQAHGLNPRVAVVDRLGVTGARVDLARAALQQRGDDRLPDPAIGAGDQRDGSLDLHALLLSSG